MNQREARMLRRRWLAEQMGALVAAMQALPKVADPPGPYREGMEPAAYVASLLAHHEAIEAYCAAWDRLQEQYVWHVEEVIENVRCESHPNDAELRFIAAYDQWKEYIAAFMAEDARLAENARLARDRAINRK